MIAKTFAGLEGVLADELRGIGAQDIKVLRRAVSFKGDDEILYKANYLCRTALRILILIDDFNIKNEEDLYNRIAKTNWSDYTEKDHTFAVDAVVFNSCITHTKYAALKIKDAIVDQFRRKYGTRPDIDTSRPDFRLSIHIENDNCLLYIDSSGSSLSKRGYRVAANEAPLNEVLAAGLIKLSGWDGKTNFVDPMCGSGTILIEAAMIACNIPAGYYRKYFSFINWKSFNSEAWRKVVSESESDIKEHEGEIYGSDISKESIKISTQNIQRAKLHHDITLNLVSIQDSIAPEGGGILITNPPYDERLEVEDATILYQEIGDTLKSSYKGFQSWILSSNTDAMKFIGLATEKKINLFNGALECTFAKYEIYEGSKRNSSRRDPDFKPNDSKEYKPRRNEEIMDYRREDYRRKREEISSDKSNDRREFKPFNRDEKRGENRFDREGANRGDRSFKPRENNSYKRSDREDKPFRRDNDRREFKPFNRDEKRGEKRFDKEGANRGDRSFKPRENNSYKRSDREDKPFRRDNDRKEFKPFNRDEKRGEKRFDREGANRGDRSFKPRENNSYKRSDREDKPFRRDNDRREFKPFNRDEKRGEKRFDREGKSSKPRHRRS